MVLEVLSTELDGSTQRHVIIHTVVSRRICTLACAQSYCEPH